jgi:hypothetical protein
MPEWAEQQEEQLMDKLPWYRKPRPTRFAGVVLQDHDTVIYKGECQPIMGVTAGVEDLFLTIQGPAFRWSIAVDAKKQKGAQVFAGRINMAANTAWIQKPGQ